MMKVGFDAVTYRDIVRWVIDGVHIALDERCIPRIQQNAAFLSEQIVPSDQNHYGINTGFGSMCNHPIPHSDLLQLQLNLLRSHAVGTGDYVPRDIVRMMMILKVIALVQGYSGVRVALIEQIIWFYNHDIIPVIYEQGSLGASGDLAPLSHLSLPLIGEGLVYYKDDIVATHEVLHALNKDPLVLQPKEGIALINGTQFCTAYACWSLYHADILYHQANNNLALGCETFDCDLNIFYSGLHEVRNQVGQIHCAQQINELLKDSTLCTPGNKYVQDPYSFRCAPQVHGASYDTLRFAEDIINREIIAVSDNPILFPDEGLAISGGNFHAQPIALILDYLKIAVSELASISERRAYKLLSGTRGLPINLTANPGLESGLMMLQYTAASIVSQNKQLSSPASVDSIVSSAGQEDHVSMGANAATAAKRVIDNVYRVLAIEWMISVKGVSFKTASACPTLKNLITDYTKILSIKTEDANISLEINGTVEWIKNLNLPAH